MRELTAVYQGRLKPPVAEFQERFGFVWVVATPADDYDFDSFLDPLEADLA